MWPTYGRFIAPTARPVSYTHLDVYKRQATQHIGESLVIEDFRRRPDDADGLLVGTVGEIEAVQPVIRCRKPNPGLGLSLIHI